MSLEVRTDKKPHVALGICIPSLGMWTSDFGLSLVQMIAYITATLFENDQNRSLEIIEKRSSNLPRLRQECLEDAVLKGCTHALFIDSDQSFPHDMAHRLLAHKKQVVGANIAIKTMPSFPTARNRGASPFGVPVTSDPYKHGLEKVWRIGCGIVLVDLALVKAIKRPWFEIRYNEKVGEFEGEDWFFMQKLEASGADIWIDHDLSRQIGHVGQFVYGHPHIPSVELEKAA